MKVTVVLEQQDFDAMHDVVLEALDIEPTNEQIQQIWNRLPDDVQGIAIQWGTSDTVFREDLYEWLEKMEKI